ncbi:unnamed protein product [Rotaria sordida]|uniref:Major facilitator superfamily (MFS) profile domain-containing protein n=1 Tax=Rotaria sordida TaxID=392033 RepID=A0A814XH69_9BILA|nr:unnamed protein product [Rotaria sordida]
MTENIQQKTNPTTNYLFRNVTELTLTIDRKWPIGSIEHLSTIVNLSNLQTVQLYFRTWLSTALQLGTCTALISGLIGDKIGRKRIIQILTILQVIPIVLTQLLLQFVSMSLDSKFGAVVEGIGYVSASILMMTRLGRKFSMLFYALLTSVCVIIIPFVIHTNPLVVVIVSQIGKLTISGAVSVSWIYVPELFPTSMRGFGNAVLVVFGRVGAILAPIVDAALGDRYIRITFYVYSVLGLVIVGLLFILPETRNRSFDSHDEGHNNLAASNIHINEVIIENPSYDASTHY